MCIVIFMVANFLSTILVLKFNFYLEQLAVARIEL